MLLRAIINSIESVAPRSAQQEWDNSGMQVGDTECDVQSVLLTTDVTLSVLDEAICLGCQLIISHHPLLFHGLKQVCGQTPQACIIEKAILHHIAIYSAHTNLDCAEGGINSRLADKLGIVNYRPLDEATQLGVIGCLQTPVPYVDFIRRVYDILHPTYIRYTEPSKSIVQTIALCGGAGSEFINAAIEQGADVYLTADCKYHEMQESAGFIGLIDVDHWVSEHHAPEIFRDILTPLGLQCFISRQDKTPIKVFEKK